MSEQEANRQDSRNRSIRWTIKEVVEPLHQKLKRELDPSELYLWGEVVESHSRRSLLFLTLLDSRQDHATIEATVPLSPSEPEKGDMICILGKYDSAIDGACIKITFKGTRIHENKGSSKRRGERRNLLKELGQRCPPPAELSGPVRRLALVSSRESKAVDDFNGMLAKERHSPVEVDRVLVALTDAESIAHGIRDAGAQPGIDLIVVTRGGGNPSDLMPFDDPAVVTAIAETTARVPVVVAVGHSSDKTAADRVASYSEPTPTSAARFVAKKSWPKDPRWSSSPPPSSSITEERAQTPLAALHSLLRRLLRVAAVIAMAFALFAAGWTSHGVWTWLAQHQTSSVSEGVAEPPTPPPTPPIPSTSQPPKAGKR